MTKYIGIILLMLSVTAQGQTKKEVKNDLIVIDSKEKAEKYKLNNPKWEIELVELNDTDSDIPKKLTKLKKGQSKRIKVNREKYHYKLIEKAKESEFRASYIYLNGSELSKKQIDSLRPLIIEKYNLLEIQILLLFQLIYNGIFHDSL